VVEPVFACGDCRARRMGATYLCYRLKALGVGPLVSRKIPLEDLQKGMEEALRGGPVMKVLVDLVG